jgi:Uma2 family endonuclease
MARKVPITEQRVVLSDVSWQQFEKLLAELGPDRQTRLTYWRGKLLDSLILLLTDELNIPLTSLSPILLIQPDLGCATEPDTCYYLEEQPPTRDLDLGQDVPPDLVVEVALTRSNIDKLPIYASLGIPEVWRYLTTADEDLMLKGQLSIYQLQDEDYVEQPRSEAFPFLSAARILEFMEQSDSMSLSASLRLLRAWIQERQR